MAGDAKHAAQRRTFVHHQQHISQSGDDSEWNLITLGAACHKNVHRGA
jgi:predicted HNH restriction endonuclease